MSWMADLCTTYDACFKKELSFQPRTKLLPLAHSTQNAQIEIVLGENGVFRRAEVVPKEDSVTAIPVTEDSINRTSGLAAHPLCDKLEYLAGDFEQFTGKDNLEKFSAYLEQLQDWVQSDFSCKKLESIYAYIQKKTVMADLVQAGILQAADGRLTNDKLEGFPQQDAFVRFRVEIFLEDEPRVYKDEELQQKYIDYYTSKKPEQDLCYATGRVTACSSKHNAKIRNTADKAKLISSNDSSGFTYRGRFSDSSQVASIGYETSQKALHTLRWLVENQGFHCGEQVVVAWELQGRRIPDFNRDTADTLLPLEDTKVSTAVEYAEKLKKAVYGYRQNLNAGSNVVVMGLEAATTGRLAISFYKKMSGSDYLNNIEFWHNSCFWQHEYKYKKKDGKTQWYSFIGAPSLRDIAVTIYGSANDKVIKFAIERLIPCVTDRKRLPCDMVNTALNRIFRPGCFENEYEFQKALSITCALVRKHYYDKNKEECDVALDENDRERSYLYGRLLATAQVLEEVALYHQGINRMTAAERYREAFRKHPYRTWQIIESCLDPYKAYLKKMKNTFYANKISEIVDLFEKGEHENDAPLSGRFALGYHCQRRAYREKKQENTTGEDNDNNEGSDKE